MDNENLDSLFDDVFTQDTAAQPTEPPAGDDGQQESKGTEQKQSEPAADQGSEERSRNAERRKRREQRLVDDARNAERAEMDSVVASLGIENPDTGETFMTYADLKAYSKTLRAQRVAGGKATENDIREIAQEAIQAQSQQTSNADVDKELDMIREMDPAMTDLGAILQSDIGADFRKYVDGGATFVQAYGRAVREKNARADGTKASAAAKTAGKGHLNPTSSRGTGAVEVPAETKEMYRLLMPDMTDDEIQKAYNADLKKFGS